MKCVRHVLHSLGNINISNHILEDYFYEYDRDDSGSLSFKEFKKLMKKMLKCYDSS
jgi:Ca2+-binding EF-hand superfamily protein